MKDSVNKSIYSNLFSSASLCKNKFISKSQNLLFFVKWWTWAIIVKNYQVLYIFKLTSVLQYYIESVSDNMYFDNSIRDMFCLYTAP